MGTISTEHGDRLFWLGRYTERAFTTLTALEKLYDKAIDASPDIYTEFLSCFGLENVYLNRDNFFKSFIFDKNNPSSVFFSLIRAYDNGIVLREEISTEALSFLQMAMDKIDKVKSSEQGLRLSLLPLADTLYGFWGCIWDYVIDEELAAIIGCGKYVERLDLYLRLKYPFADMEREFKRLCTYLGKIPKNTPYRYNTKQLSMLVEYMGADDDSSSAPAIRALGKLFERAG